MSTGGGERPAGPAGAAAGADRLVELALAEDVGDGDRTTAWTVPAGAVGEARVLAREPGVAAGTAAARRVFRRLSSRVRVRAEVEDGGTVEPGATVLRLSGPLAPILTAERVALNFLSQLSGVATLTRRFVRAVEHTDCRVTDTRKTTPGWRALEKAATRAGGAVNHRMGLYDMVLIKENHIRAVGGVGRALEAVAGPAAEEGLAVEVEVETIGQLEAALEAEPDRVLLDNMSPDELRRAVRLTEEGGGPAPELEASGGLTLEAAAAAAEAGVDLVSVGRITHSAPALDLSLLVEHVEEA